MRSVDGAQPCCFGRPPTLGDTGRVEKCFVEILRCFRAPHLETFITDSPDLDDWEFDSDDNGDSDDEEPLSEAIMPLREKFRRASGRLVSISCHYLISAASNLVPILTGHETAQFLNSDRLNEISITAQPGVTCDMLVALKRRMPVHSGSYSECRAPKLKTLRIKLPEYGEFRLSTLEAFVESLAFTLTRRVAFGSHLDRLVVSECLMTKASWNLHMPNEITEKAEGVPCLCDSHSLAAWSDENEVDIDSGGDSDSDLE